MQSLAVFAGVIVGLLVLSLAGRRFATATDDTNNQGALERVLDFTYTAENIVKDATGSRRSMHEGFRAAPYQDTAGNWTIGYGHKLGDAEWYASIDEAQGTHLLADDIRVAEDAVNSLVSVDLSQAQFDALVSFVFNIGAGAFRKSTLLAKLNAGDVAGASAQFPRWIHSGGRVDPILVARREDEQRLFLQS